MQKANPNNARMITYVIADQNKSEAVKLRNLCFVE